MKWDSYFSLMCEAASTKSPCLSRKIGAILVRENSIVATGYNGPARGVVHCGADRLNNDKLLHTELLKDGIGGFIDYNCPRKIMGYESGKGLEWCLATHAEQNTIANAARLGVSTIGTTLYMNCVLPCKDCVNLLINAGIVEIVVTSTESYDHYGKFILEQSNIKVREFEDEC